MGTVTDYHNATVNNFFCCKFPDRVRVNFTFGKPELPKLGPLSSKVTFHHRNEPVRDVFRIMLFDHLAINTDLRHRYFFLWDSLKDSEVDLGSIWRSNNVTSHKPCFSWISNKTRLKLFELGMGQQPSVEYISSVLWLTCCNTLPQGRKSTICQDS